MGTVQSEFWIKVQMRLAPTTSGGNHSVQVDAGDHVDAIITEWGTNDPFIPMLYLLPGETEPVTLAYGGFYLNTGLGAYVTSDYVYNVGYSDTWGQLTAHGSTWQYLTLFGSVVDSRYVMPDEPLIGPAVSENHGGYDWTWNSYAWMSFNVTYEAGFTKFADNFSSDRSKFPANVPDFNPAIANNLHALGGNDVVHAGKGADWVYGDGGDDWLWGDAGDDIIDGGNGRDNIEGGSGSDTIRGGNSADWLHGNADSDIIYGEWGDDFLDGGLGRDTLDGGDGKDTFIASDGRDGLFGGSGSDTFDFRNANSVLTSGVRQVLDGGPDLDGEQDVLLLSGSADDYDIAPVLKESWERSHTFLHASNYTLDTSRIQKASFDSIFGGMPQVVPDSEALAMSSRLARDVYSETAGPFVGRGWRPIEAIELGIKMSDFNLGNGYTFINGVYERIAPGLLTINDAVAMVMVGDTVGNGRTLSVTFKGSDLPWEDPADWFADISTLGGADGLVSEYFNYFKPLVEGLYEYITEYRSEINTVLVSGHSLGGGIAQYFIDSLIGAEVISASKIEGYTFASIGGSGDTDTLVKSKMINFVPKGDATELLNPGDGKRAGSVITIDGPTSRDGIPVNAHYMENIHKDIEIIEKEAISGGYFSRSNLAEAIRSSDVYRGPNFTIGVGHDSSDNIEAGRAYRYVLAEGGMDKISVLGLARDGGRFIDGGAGTRDTVEIARLSTDCSLTATDDGGYTIRLAATNELICQIYNVERLRFEEGIRPVDDWLIA